MLMFSLIILMMLLVSLIVVSEWSFSKESVMNSCKGFLGLLIGKGYDSYSVKSLMYIIFIVFMYSFYHFIGFTEEVWCNIVFSGGLVGVMIMVMMSMWLMCLRVGWGMKSAGGLKYQGGMSWWMLLSKIYHHLSTPLVMLLRVFMNFLIGQSGKWGLIIMGLSASFISWWMVSAVFFAYELMVVVLQSFIFSILSYEVLGLLYPNSVKVKSGKRSSSGLGLLLLVVVICLLG
uniref:ATP synthase F0 subunit 6 n=1 Tax=Philometroides sanguineus TaxID=378106 RepID=A0A0U1V613_9BILA|nr:ATP synthase F0 subunit 6 [Philometroides sanguineus]AIN37112.1 ATP synthase F0 subunit 6 [Philometroides sanguineus]